MGRSVAVASTSEAMMSPVSQVQRDESQHGEERERESEVGMGGKSAAWIRLSVVDQCGGMVQRIAWGRESSNVTITAPYACQKLAHRDKIAAIMMFSTQLRELSTDPSTSPQKYASSPLTVLALSVTPVKHTLTSLLLSALP